jgi:tripartite-type tricarboxylate transporter receptor subunit TctC
VPPEYVRKLYETLKVVMADREVREKMGTVGADPVGSSPEQFAPFMRSEVDKWRKVIKSSGITVD